MQSARQKIAALLEQAIGLNTSSFGSISLDRAIHCRMRELGLGDESDYYTKLSDSQAELRILVEEVVVPETWFFRDKGPFQCLIEYIDKSGKDFSRDILRILSLPCSTGEEPYSIAIALLQKEMDPASFYIDAIDVSERGLARARRGVYGDNSFRSRDLSFRDKYFDLLDQGYSLKSQVREKVRFFQGNILQKDFMRGLGLYDVIFCRNILIYFNEEARRQAVDTLHHLLLANGILFTGYAEAILFYSDRFMPVPHPGAFAFYKKKQDAFRGRGIPVKDHDRKISGRPAASPPFLQRPRNIAVLPAPGGALVREEEKFLLVRELADKGRLEEAAGLCEEFMTEHGPSARWFFLLGVIRDSQGRADEALKLLRKALYLDPEDVDSLIQLSLLAQRAGDPAMAENYRRRARKNQEGG